MRRGVMMRSKWFAGLLLVLGGCVGEVTDVASHTEGLSVPTSNLTNQSGIATQWWKSALITNRNGFSKVEANISLGDIITDLANTDFASHGDNPGVYGHVMFRTARRQFNEHARAPAAGRLGVVNRNNPWQHVLDLWPAVKGNQASIGNGPFRLLAVVGRLDLAGDFDVRSSHRVTDEVRAIGEGRLIWGLVDDSPGWEGGATPKPYPMTIITEFRLPPLGPRYNVYRRNTQTDIMRSDWQWRTQMQRWGQLWRELSRYGHNSQAYKDLLWDIVSRYATPENLIAIRANVELSRDDDPSNDEFELRGWYRQRAGNILPRRLRDEIFPCLTGSGEFRDFLEQYWVASRADLDMNKFDPTRPTRFGVLGYRIPRHGDSQLAGGTNMPDLLTLFPGHTCPTDATGDRGTLFQMWTSANPPQNTYDINGFNPPFARVRRNDVHGGHPQEDRRHAFAIRTCSGCHGSEAGIFGFHVFPRLAGANSAVSTFVQNNGPHTIEFSHGGNHYNYSAGSDRKDWIDRAADRDPTMVPGESLYRDDRI